ncbi:MAG: hypothetical protein ABUK01_10125 [Leptospirales bacterium]
MDSQQYDITTSKLKGVWHLLLGLFFVCLTFWTKLTLNVFSIVFNKQSMNEKMETISQEIDKNGALFQGVSESVAAIIIAILIFALGAFYLYKAFKKLFDFRAQISLSKDGLYIRTKDLIPWSEIHSMDITKVETEWDAGESGSGTSVKYFLKVLLTNTEKVSVDLKNLSWNYNKFGRSFDTFNTNENIKFKTWEAKRQAEAKRSQPDPPDRTDHVDL